MSRRDRRSTRRRLRPASSAVLVIGVVAAAAAGSGAATTRAPTSRPARSSTATPAATRAATPPAAGPAAAVTAFGVDLMARIGGSGNMVFSPYSVASVVAMAGTGASGATARQIAGVLHLRSAKQIAGIGTLSGTLAREQSAAAGGAKDAPQLDLANGLFLQQGFPLLPAFTRTLASGFGAGPQPVDFEHDPTAATAAINQFVSSHTAGVIPTILSPGQLDSTTRLALVNAIYLKAGWAEPFQVSATASGGFRAPGGTRTVRFMNETDALPYMKGPGYQAVELPYRSSTLALLVLKPAGTEATLQKAVTPGLIRRTTAALRPVDVGLRMPRFHVSLAATLNSALARLGMTDAFSPTAADFLGISRTPLYLSLVQHEADFTVDEQGTIATAATVGGLSTTSVEVPPRPAVTVDLNRPFPFYLIDTKTGAVIFAGRLTDPSAAPAP
ncbi:MAG TPA: serpin family protein [Solirubrobacteraceae bacterium]